MATRIDLGKIVPQKGVDYFDGQNGQDGTNGTNGVDGQDGYSPTVSLSKSGKTTTLVITDKNGEHTATIVDGNDGQNGQDGRDGTNGTNGQDGADGQDGVSPAVTVETIQGGHQVTITDATHPQGQSFNVMDGQVDVPWTKLVDTELEEDTTDTGFSVNLNKNCSKLKIIAVFPANESISSNTSCYIGMTGQSGSTTLICGSSPLRSTPAKVIAEYTFESGLGWQGVISQFANATFNEDGNNAYSVNYTNLRGANVGAVYSVRIYGNQIPLLAGTKIQIWGK